MLLPPCFRGLVPVVLLGYALTVPGAAFAQKKGAASEPKADAPAADPSQDGEPGGPEQEPAVSPLVAHQQEVLRKSLQEVQHDRASTSTLLPWLVTGAGAAMLLAGLLIGASSTLGCGDHCTGAPPGPAWLVVAGTSAGIAGMVWLVSTEQDLAEIETREYRIKTELERMQWNAEPVPRASLAPALSLRASF